MNALSLFSGIGGIDLAGEWAGIKTVAMCEREPFCQKVLKKHWPDVPIYDDVCTLTKERLEADGIDCNTIGLISAGYPCQPYSVAGEREGEEDDRALWPEVLRIIKDIRPRWFIGENVVGHITLGLDGVLSNLESENYTARPIVLPACAVNAPFRRDRVFVMAFTAGIGLEKLPKRYRENEALYNETPNSFDPFSAVKGFYRSRNFGHIRRGDGIPDRAHRIKAIGNAVVPQQIYPILAAIKQIDDHMKEVEE